MWIAFHPEDFNPKEGAKIAKEADMKYAVLTAKHYDGFCLLKRVGQWMQQHGESIYGCGKADLPSPEWGRYTQKDKLLYAHWMYPKIGPINVKIPDDQVRFTTVLPNRSEAYRAARWWGSDGEGNLFINVAEPIHRTCQLPDSLDTVIKIVMKEDQ